MTYISSCSVPTEKITRTHRSMRTFKVRLPLPENVLLNVLIIVAHNIRYPRRNTPDEKEITHNTRSQITGYVLMGHLHVFFFFFTMLTVDEKLCVNQKNESLLFERKSNLFLFLHFILYIFLFYPQAVHCNLFLF